jgi:hypothetical protein
VYNYKILKKIDPLFLSKNNATQCEIIFTALHMISFYLLFPFVFSCVVGKAIFTFPRKTNPNICACLILTWSSNLMVVFGREFFVLGTKAFKPT